MGDGDLGHVSRNAAAWDARGAEQERLGRRLWRPDVEPSWGIFSVPETEAGLLPDDLDGVEAVELGCGTAYVSAWIARRGGRPVGVDPSPNQLRIAAALQQEFGVHFPLVRAAGERVPLRDGRFDLVISEYGAAIWADPYQWIPEAARLLRRGGRLIFLGNSTLLMLCVPDEDGIPATEALRRPQFGMLRFEWPDDPTVDFHLSHGDWIRLLRANRFVVEDLLELRPGPDAATGYPFVTLEWARKWPCEEVWRARRE